jgi:hypothetical protein
MSFRVRTRERKRELVRVPQQKWRGHVLLAARATHRKSKKITSERNMEMLPPDKIQLIVCVE